MRAVASTVGLSSEIRGKKLKTKDKSFTRTVHKATHHSLAAALLLAVHRPSFTAGEPVQQVGGVGLLLGRGVSAA